MFNASILFPPVSVAGIFLDKTQPKTLLRIQQCKIMTVKRLQMRRMRSFFHPPFSWIKSVYLCQQRDEKNLPLDREKKKKNPAFLKRTDCSYCDNDFFLLASLRELKKIISLSNYIGCLTCIKTARQNPPSRLLGREACTFPTLPLHQVLGLV